MLDSLPAVRDRPWIQATLILAVAAVLVAGTNLAVLAAASEPVYELPTYQAHLDPGDVAWNLTGEDAPKEMTIYRFSDEQRSAQDAIRVALELGMDPTSIEYDLSQRAYWIGNEEAGTSLIMDDYATSYSYTTDISYGGIGEEPRHMATDEEAKRIAAELLKEGDLLPAGASFHGEPTVGPKETVHACETGPSANATDGSCTRIPITIAVRYTREVDGYPAVWSSGLQVILGDGGDLRGVSLEWPALQEAGREATIGYEEALDQARSFRGAIVWAPGGCDHGTVDRVRVGYYDPFREDAERPWVFPVYEFLGTCYDRQGQPLERDDPLRVLVPAVR